MKKTIGFTAVAALAFAGITGIASAALEIETFENLTSFDPDAAPATGNSTVTNAVWTDDFGSATADATLNTQVVVDDTTDFDNATDDTYIQWTGLTDQYNTLTISPALGLASPTINFAFPIRVDNLEATGSDNGMDIILVAEGGSTTFGIVVDAGELRMATSNGFTGVSLSTTAFGDAGSAGAWDDGNWRILAGSLTLDSGGNGSAVWNVLDVTTGVATELANVTGLTNVRTPSQLDFVGFGASFDIPQGTNTGVSIDGFSIHDAALDVPSFLAEVRTDYGLPAPASVSDWNLFEN